VSALDAARGPLREPDPAFAGAVADGLAHDITRSKEVRLDEWRRRPVWQRALEKLAKVLIEQY
jgi:hypothetical protein